MEFQLGNNFLVKITNQEPKVTYYATLGTVKQLEGQAAYPDAKFFSFEVFVSQEREQIGDRYCYLPFMRLDFVFSLGKPDFDERKHQILFESRGWFLLGDIQSKNAKSLPKDEINILLEIEEEVHTAVNKVFDRQILPLFHLTHQKRSLKPVNPALWEKPPMKTLMSTKED